VSYARLANLIARRWWPTNFFVDQGVSAYGSPAGTSGAQAPWQGSGAQDAGQRKAAAPSTEEMVRARDGARALLLRRAQAAVDKDRARSHCRFVPPLIRFIP
jgi:hypothetical protein